MMQISDPKITISLQITLLYSIFNFEMALTLVYVIYTIAHQEAKYARITSVNVYFVDDILNG